MKSEMRTETSWMDQSPTEAGTHSGRMNSFSIHRLEDWCEEKVGYILHQITLQNSGSLIIQLYLRDSSNEGCQLSTLNGIKIGHLLLPVELQCQH